MWLFCRKAYRFRLIFGQIRAKSSNSCHVVSRRLPPNRRGGISARHKPSANIKHHPEE
jgi:hypothetical protein